MIQQSYLWVYFQRKWNHYIKDIFILLCHWSIIYDNQDMETSQVFIIRWMGKEYVVNIHNRILIFSHKKKGNSAICNNMDWALR